MWYLALAFADTVHEERFQLEPLTLEAGGVRLNLQGYAYAIERDESCVGIAVDGPGSAQLPTTLRNAATWHGLDLVLAYDPEACELLVRPEPLEQEGAESEVVVVESRKRDRSLARLRRALRDRTVQWEAWGLEPERLELDQRLIDVRHEDRTGRVEARSTTGWSTLIDDPYQQVEYGFGALVLESARGGAPHPVHRGGSVRRGVHAEQITVNVEATDLGRRHTLKAQARLQLSCTQGPCRHVSLLMPTTYDYVAGGPEVPPALELTAASFDGEPVPIRDGAFGRSAVHTPLAYRPITVPIALETGETGLLDLSWSDALVLSVELRSPVLDEEEQVLQYQAFHRDRPGPEWNAPVDLSRETTLLAHRDHLEPRVHVTGVRYSEPRVEPGTRPRTLVPTVVGQAGGVTSEVRLVRPSTGMKLYLHGEEVETHDRLQIARSTVGGPWVGAGRYGEPLSEGGVTMYLSTGFLRERSAAAISRVRALHEIFSAQLVPRPVALALFEGPSVVGPRPTYGASGGMAWLRPHLHSGRVAEWAPFPEPEDRAFIYAVASQWFDRPTATLEPWLRGAFVELYTDLVFEAVHGPKAAGAWRSRPEAIHTETFEDFGLVDRSPALQQVYAVRALELVRLAIGPKPFNQAVRAMLQTDQALSAELLARHFVQPEDQRLVRDALIDGICPSVELTWRQERLGRAYVDIVADYDRAPLVVPIVLKTKQGPVQHFAELEDGKATLDFSSRLKVRGVQIDPYGRLPLCSTKVLHEEN